MLVSFESFAKYLSYLDPRSLNLKDLYPESLISRISRLFGRTIQDQNAVELGVKCDGVFLPPARLEPLCENPPSPKTNSCDGICIDLKADFQQLSITEFINLLECPDKEDLRTTRELCLKDHDFFKTALYTVYRFCPFLISEIQKEYPEKAFAPLELQKIELVEDEQDYILNCMYRGYEAINRRLAFSATISYNLRSKEKFIISLIMATR